MIIRRKETARTEANFAYIFMENYKKFLRKMFEAGEMEKENYLERMDTLSGYVPRNIDNLCEMLDLEEERKTLINAFNPYAVGDEVNFKLCSDKTEFEFNFNEEEKKPSKFISFSAGLSAFHNELYEEKKANPKGYKKTIARFTAMPLLEWLDWLFKKYKINPKEKKHITYAFQSLSYNVPDISPAMQIAVKQELVNGVIEGLSSRQTASNMYWNIQKKGINYNIPQNEKNLAWWKVAHRKFSYFFKLCFLASYAEQAEKSLSGGEPVYFVFTRGTCAWCREHRGTIVRLVPVEIVKDKSNDSLKKMGIRDPYTDTAIWPGKRNSKRKRKNWLVSCPPHPYSRAEFMPINPETEEYDAILDVVDDKPLKFNTGDAWVDKFLMERQAESRRRTDERRSEIAKKREAEEGRNKRR